MKAYSSGDTRMKTFENKLTCLAIVLTLTLSMSAGAYLIYRVWDYWSAEQTYADMGRGAVQKIKVAGQTNRNQEANMSNNASERKGESDPGYDTYGRKTADGTGILSTDADLPAEIIDGTAIPDKPVIDWNELAKSGKDIVAWLDIPALAIAYPVVQGDDNEFYLHHLPNGEYKNAGSLFMEAANSRDLTDINTVIYGHNMDNGSMFGKFRNMTEEEYRSQPFLWLCTREKACLYAMISLHISRVDDESYTLFEMEEIADDRMSDRTVKRSLKLTQEPASAGLQNLADSHVTGWIQNENLRSYINMPIPKAAFGRIVTLSTCASHSDERRVLQAILVREFAP